MRLVGIRHVTASAPSSSSARSLIPWHHKKEKIDRVPYVAGLTFNTITMGVITKDWAMSPPYDVYTGKNF